jgi:hypothetical protein
VRPQSSPQIDPQATRPRTGFARAARSATTRVVAGTVVLAALVAALIAILSAEGDPHVVREGPAGSVERFLSVAGSGNGDAACGYLSIAETRRVEIAAGPHVACSDAFMTAQLDLGGRNYLDDLARVRFSATGGGDRARVDVTAGKASMQFTLAPASATTIEQQRYQPPSTNWRITSGATALVRPVP